MKLVDAYEHKHRIQWLKKNRAELCPDCSGESFKKKDWDYTRWCPSCRQIWKSIGDKWEYED